MRHAEKLIELADKAAKTIHLKKKYVFSIEVDWNQEMRFYRLGIAIDKNGTLEKLLWKTDWMRFGDMKKLLEGLMLFKHIKKYTELGG